MQMKAMDLWSGTLLLCFMSMNCTVAQTVGGDNLKFIPTGRANEFKFDTGLLRGNLRAGGKSLGLSSVFYGKESQRLDRSMGLLSHYRVFTVGRRYGAGAWDWPSEAKLLPDGSVETRWEPEAARPFDMRCVYRLIDVSTVEVETIVTAREDLRGFESFLASYFSENFSNALAYVRGKEFGHGGQWMAAEKSFGDWLMFPRDPGVLRLIRDGRWDLEPHPVKWTIMPELAAPVAMRKQPATGLTAVMMAGAKDCFAVAMPYQTEGHYSVYLSLFGCDMKAGESRAARARLIIKPSLSDAELMQMLNRL